LKSRSEINVIVAGKTVEPRWLTEELAKKELAEGLMVWDFASDKNPDIVICGVGDYLTKEALASVDIIKTEAPEIKIRFVNILELRAMGIGTRKYLSTEKFAEYFTENKPVIFNFHGYPETLEQSLFAYENARNRFSVHGYMESGSTTTQFDMQIRNKTSRWHLAMETFERMAKAGVITKEKADALVSKYEQKLKEHREYIIKHGIDPEEIENWVWSR
jgi:xylulose-5-phosphate/fructose-6-phosphate phosphoketolase